MEWHHGTVDLIKIKCDLGEMHSVNWNNITIKLPSPLDLFFEQISGCFYTWFDCLVCTRFWWLPTAPAGLCSYCIYFGSHAPIKKYPHSLMLDINCLYQTPLYCMWSLCTRGKVSCKYFDLRKPLQMIRVWTVRMKSVQNESNQISQTEQISDFFANWFYLLDQRSHLFANLPLQFTIIKSW